MTPASDVLALLRPRIGLLAGAGALAGGLAHGSGPGGLGLGLAAALALSAGCSALNQVQERAVDARMERTRNRPLPSGRMRPAAALAVALCCLGLGLAALWASPGGARAALLAPLAVLLYNGLYTPLKKRTSLALLVGGLAGALPPAVGFAAAGGSPLDPRALLLAGVFYAWQVPHFWCFARLHAADYAAAGLRIPQQGLDPARAAAMLRLWMVCLGALVLLVPAFGLLSGPAPKLLAGVLGLVLCAAAGPLPGRERLGFALVNASLALLLCLLAADALAAAP